MKEKELKVMSPFPHRKMLPAVIEEEYDDDEIIEVECPECGETVCFFDTMLDEEEEAEVVEILCPKCDAVVYTFERDLIIEDEEEDEE